MPGMESSSTRILKPSAKVTFWFTILLVLLATFMPTASLPISSSISTTSAASIAASEPIAPMAIPRSAAASTGASLMPSPTNAVLSPSAPFCFSIHSTLFSGSSSLWNSSSCSSSATAAAVSLLSPVSITIFRIPCLRNAARESAMFSFSVSATRMYPKNLPPFAT